MHHFKLSFRNSRIRSLRTPWRPKAIFRSYFTSAKSFKAEDFANQLELMVLDKCNDLNVIRDASREFESLIASMLPLQIIRCLNCFKTFGYSNEFILAAVAERINDLCDYASPRRLSDLLSLFRLLNLTHESVVSPLIANVVKSMHNYTVELSDVCVNASHLNVFDDFFFESITTQIELNFDILKFCSIRILESLSRYRKTSSSLEKLKQSVESIESIKSMESSQKNNLKIGECLYLLGALFKLNCIDKANEILNIILENIRLKCPTDSDISTILTLKYSMRILVPELLDSIVDAIELRLDNDEYLKKHFCYHFYMLQVLGFAKTEISMAILERVAPKLEFVLSSKGALQLLYSIALITSSLACPFSNVRQFCQHAAIHGNLSESTIDEIFSIIKNRIESNYKSLSVREQDRLFDALYCISMHRDVGKILSRVLDEKIPSRLPLMGTGMPGSRLGEVSGKSFLFGSDSCGRVLDPFICMNEYDVLNIFGAGRVVKSPSTMLNVYILKRLLRFGDTSDQKIDFFITSTNLARLIS